MKNIIKELYYGNIDPQARGFKKDSYLQKQMTIMSNSEEILAERLVCICNTGALSFLK